jgi:hypothetical protein
MQTPWVAVKNGDEHAAMTECAMIWNKRLSRPPVATGDLRDLVEKELGACDSQVVIDLLARNDSEWEERGPIFKILAQRLVDASVVTIDSWPIDPVLRTPRDTGSWSSSQSGLISTANGMCRFRESRLRANMRTAFSRTALQLRLTRCRTGIAGKPRA